MVNGTPKRRETVNEYPVPENMIDTKAVLGRAPSPVFPVAMPCTPKVGKASFPDKSQKEIGTIEVCPGSFDVEIISTGVEISDYNEGDVGILLRNVITLVKEGSFGVSSREMASQNLDALSKLDQH